jgi:hypothetical protein
MATEDDKEETKTPGVTSALAIVGAVAGGAAWVSVVGSFILAARLQPLGVPPGPTVSLVPTEHRFVVGLGFLAAPLIAAVVAYLVLLYVRPQDGTEDERLNPPGASPRGLFAVCSVAAVGGAVVGALSDSASSWGTAVLVVLPFVAAFLIYHAVRRTAGWMQAGLALFAGVAAYAGLMALVYEAGRDTRLDIAALVRKDGTVVTGFYVSKTDTAVYLVTPTFAGSGVSPPAGRTAKAMPPVVLRNDKRCPQDEQAQRLRGEGSRCYLNELVAVPADDVKRIVLGPRDVVVDAKGYRAAAALAGLSALPGDAPRPQPTKTKTKKKKP